MDMKTPGADKRRQRLLQLAMGGLLILIVIFVELLAVTPEGVYVYTGEGIRDFSIGAQKTALLKEINRNRGIRTLTTCHPESRLDITSRKGFEMTAQMAAARFWRCLDRKHGVYLFEFSKDHRLIRIIHLNDLPDPDDPFALFFQCPDDKDGPDRFLERQTRYPVYYR
mgnify:CR=1 FL=1